MLSNVTPECIIEDEPDESPFNSAEENGDKCEDVTRRVVYEWDIHEKNREVDECHNKPAHVSLDVPRGEYPTTIECDNEERVDGKQQAGYWPASDDCSNAHGI
jgi:hypothetical protein